jgi:hypothetical protein
MKVSPDNRNIRSHRSCKASGCERERAETCVRSLTLAATISDVRFGTLWILAMAFGTGFVHCAGQPAAEPVVELPPMVVEERSSVPWLYVRADDAEYLSRCSAATTRAYSEMRRSRLQWLRALFPEALFLRMDVPVTTVLFSQTVKAGNSAEVLGEVINLNKQRGVTGGFVGSVTAPNMALNDLDAVAIFASINEATFDHRQLTISSDYVRFLLETRRPELPAWLREGMLNVYDDIEFTEKPITLRPLKWHSAIETRALTRNTAAPRTLITMGEMFSDAPRFTLGRLGVSHAALLLRWALDPANGVREPFWRFALRACEEPVTESMFTSCFGFGFSDLRDRLSDYLAAAVKGPTQISLAELPKLPALEIRRASPAEIARLRGEWERLCVPMVRRLHPAHAGRYLDQARRTLQSAYDAGDRDPRMLAIRGLCELDAGEVNPGREFLELATTLRVVRPRAYYELARLRWAALVDAEPTRELSASEVMPVLELLRTGLRQAPTLPNGVRLLAEVWLRCEHAPRDDEWQELARLGRLFAADSPVCLRVAQALARHGQAAEAVDVLGAGFLRVRDDTTRQQFAQAYSAIVKKP